MVVEMPVVGVGVVDIAGVRNSLIFSTINNHQM